MIASPISILNIHLPWIPMDSHGLQWSLMDFICCFFFLTSTSHSITTCFATTATMLLLNFTMRLSWSCRSLGLIWFSQWLLWCECMCSGVDDTIYCHSQLSSGGIWCMAQQFQTRLYNCPPHRLDRAARLAVANWHRRWDEPCDYF